MDKWEYFRPKNYLSDQELNDLGKQGWEIAAFDQSTTGGYTFKRKLPSSPTQNVQKTKPAQSPNFDDDFGIGF